MYVLRGDKWRRKVMGSEWPNCSTIQRWSVPKVLILDPQIQVYMFPQVCSPVLCFCYVLSIFLVNFVLNRTISVVLQMTLDDTWLLRLIDQALRKDSCLFLFHLHLKYLAQEHSSSQSRRWLDLSFGTKGWSYIATGLKGKNIQRRSTQTYKKLSTTLRLLAPA